MTFIQNDNSNSHPYPSQLGPYKRTQIAALGQAKFYLQGQALAAAGHRPQCRSRQDDAVE